MTKYSELEQMIHWILWDAIYNIIYNKISTTSITIDSFKYVERIKLTNKYKLEINDSQKLYDCILCKSSCYNCPLNKLDGLECRHNSLYNKACNKDLNAIKTIRDIFL